MKIAFIESFLEKEWNGYTARYIEGVSGSHSAIFYLAEAIAKHKHEVTVIQQYAVFQSKWVNGVYYQSMENMPNDDQTLYDIVVCTFQLKDMNVLNKIKNYKKIAFVTGCIELSKFTLPSHQDHWFYSSPKFFSSNIWQGEYINHVNFFDMFDLDKLNILYVSENAKVNTFFINRRIETIRHHLLYNSVDIQDYSNSKGELFTLSEDKKENNFVFFACVERGYNIVLEVAKRFEGKFNIVASNYNKVLYQDVEKDTCETNDTCIISINKNVKIIHPKNSSKQEIHNWNRRSKYFIYPVFNPENRKLHYDTFGYVVLEALLCGTIVIAPRMRVFEELYGDAIYYIDTKGIVDYNDLVWSHWFEPSTSTLWDKVFPDITKSFINRYVEAVQHLESDPELRKTHIQRGFLLKDKFSNHSLAESFLRFFSS
jgi:glycosyltransferase involved in cell wall biosynthesis